MKLRQERAGLQNYKRQLVQPTLFLCLNSKVQQLAGEITTDEADRKAADEIRAKEASDFTALEKELTEILDTFKRAIGLLERHASMLKLKNANSVAQAFSVLVQATTINFKVQLLAGKITTDDADRKAAREIRAREARLQL